MAIFPSRPIILTGILCLASAAFANTSAISAQVASSTRQLSQTQQHIQQLSAEIEEREKDAKQLGIDILRLNQNVKRLSLYTEPDLATRTALGTAQAKLKQAEFHLKKNAASLEQLYARRDKARQQKHAYSLQIEQLGEQVAVARRKAEQQARLQPAKAEHKPAAIAARQPLPATTASKTSTDTLPAQQAALKPPTPLMAVPVAASATPSRPVTVTSDHKPAGQPTVATAARPAIKNQADLLPAEAALTLAITRALDASSSQPTLGKQPDLAVANPVGSSPQKLGRMKYLGNNQYMLEMRIKKGKQQFMLGKHHFVRYIPEQFDGSRCLLLVDARNKGNPTLQLVVAGI